MATAFDTYLPFDSGAGANVTESGWRSMMAGVMRDGPIITGLANTAWDGVLKPSAGAGRSVDVAAGSVWIQGHYGSTTSTKNLTVAANATGSTRYDCIVARADFVNNVVELDIVTGTTSLPALTQNTSMWEIALGYVTIANGASTVTVTDRRLCVGQSFATFTPSFAGTGWSLGNGAREGRFERINSHLHWSAKLRVGSTTAIATDALQMTMPAAWRQADDGYSIDDSWGALGMASLYYGGTVYRGVVSAKSGSTDVAEILDIADGTPWSSTSPISGASWIGVVIFMSGTYEVAH